MSKTIKTIEDFNDANIEYLKEQFNANAEKGGVNLTANLDKKSTDEFDQDIINEIVLWKVNRYVNINNAEWFDGFNKLKDITEINNENKGSIKKIIQGMLSTYMIRLPMASTMLRFRNPSVFQVIDERMFRVIFKNSTEKRKMYNSSSISKRIDIYFEYLEVLKVYCDASNLNFFEADRILWQYDIVENQNFKEEKKS